HPGEGGEDEEDARHGAFGGEGGHAAEATGVGDRGAAELHDYRSDHRNPFARASSALSTEAPAAPRSVLWPKAIILIPNTGQALTRPIMMRIPPSSSASRRGWGRSASILTWRKRRGAVRRSRPSVSGTKHSRASITAAGLGEPRSRRFRAIVCPSTTSTRLHCA